MSRFSDWRGSRRVDQEQRVLGAIAMLRPSQASGYPISRLADLGPGQTHVVLARLEGRGVLTSQWADGPHPQRRLYRVAKAEVRS